MNKWCRERESNPHAFLGQRILSPPRLPVPPSRRGAGSIEEAASGVATFLQGPASRHHMQRLADIDIPADLLSSARAGDRAARAVGRAAGLVGDGVLPRRPGDRLPLGAARQQPDRRRADRPGGQPRRRVRAFRDRRARRRRAGVARRRTSGPVAAPSSRRSSRPAAASPRVPTTHRESSAWPPLLNGTLSPARPIAVSPKTRGAPAGRAIVSPPSSGRP